MPKMHTIEIRKINNPDKGLSWKDKMLNTVPVTKLNVYMLFLIIEIIPANKTQKKARMVVAEYIYILRFPLVKKIIREFINNKRRPNPINFNISVFCLIS